MRTLHLENVENEEKTKTKVRIKAWKTL